MAGNLLKARSKSKTVHPRSRAARVKLSRREGKSGDLAVRAFPLQHLLNGRVEIAHDEIVMTAA